MEKTIVRQFVIDSDICEVIFRFDEDADKYIGDYPDFEHSERVTPKGYIWVNATQDSCAYALHKYYPNKNCLDCGSCLYYKTEKAGDLIGVCSKNERMMSDEKK